MNILDNLQKWTFDPAQRFPSDAPQPWYVCGYSFKAVNNVLRVDYLAKRRDSTRSEYDVQGGKVTYIGHPEELRGLPFRAGTLFVFDRIIDEAGRRGINCQMLAAGPAST